MACSVQISQALTQRKRKALRELAQERNKGYLFLKGMWMLKNDVSGQ